MNKKRRRNLRAWVTALCAAALCLLGVQPTWGQDPTPTTYEVTRTARSNTEFQFTMPANNVEVTVSYVDAAASVTPSSSTSPIYYATLAEAFTDATTEGDKITLLADQTGISTVLTVNNTDLTLDLNGHTISGTGGTVGESQGLIHVPTGKMLTINDNLPSAGKLENTDAGTSSTGSAIINEGTLNITGGSISGYYYGIQNTGGTLTFLGGNISGTVGIYNQSGTLNLLALTVSGTKADIYLDKDKNIIIGAALTQPENPVTVALSDENTLPYAFTSGWAEKMGTADLSKYFTAGSGQAVRLVNGEAQLVAFTELNEGSQPTLSNVGQASGELRHDVSSNPSVTEEGTVWVGDKLTAATTATPQDYISWQWYRVDDSGEETEISGATSTEYTVTMDDYGYALMVKATQAKDVAGSGKPSEDKEVASAKTAKVVRMVVVNCTAPNNATVTTSTTNPVAAGEPSAVYTIEPQKSGNYYYALTSLGLPEGVTPTIVLADDGSTTVDLPTDKKVKVKLTVPATIEGNEVTFAPVVEACGEDITINANSTTTYFDTKALKLGEGVSGITLSTVTAVTGTTVSVETINGAVPANTPFFITNSGTATTVRMDYAEDPTNFTYDDTHFKGTAEGTTLIITEGGTKYYGYNGADFVWIKESGSVVAHRCWLEIDGTAAGARLNIVWPDGSATGIGRISADDEESDWYDLNGRKLQGRPTQKGIYIRNGRKVVVK